MNDKLLKQYGEMAVKAGVNIQPGQAIPPVIGKGKINLHFLLGVFLFFLGNQAAAAGG